MEENKTENKTRDEIIEELYKDHPLDEMIKFSEVDIQDKLQDNALLILQYTEFLYKEKDQLSKIENMRNVILGDRYDYYRFNYPKELKQSEIEKFYLPKDKKVIAINNIMRRQQWRVEFFEAAVKAITSMGWNMKSYLQSLREGL
jgi:hypothetical protein